MNDPSVSDASSSSKTAKSDKAVTPKGCLVFMRVSGVVAILLFLTPAFFVIKYYAVDSPSEAARARMLDLTVRSTMKGPKADLKSKQIGRITINNSALLVADLQRDPDPNWRAQAATSLGKVLVLPYVSFSHPMEGLIAKSTLSTAAVSDPDPGVRKAASDALQTVAEHGAVIER